MHESRLKEDLEWAASIARTVAARLPYCFEVDELIQIAQIEVWKQRKRFKPKEHPGVPFRAFAWQAVRGACLMSVRRRHWTEKHAPPIEEALAWESDEGRSAARRNAWMLSEQIRDQVESLPRPLREVIELRFFRELTMRETAARLGLSETAGWAIQAQALERLKAKMGKG